MAWIRWLGIGIGVLVLLVLVVTLFLPSHYEVERAVEIAADRAVVHRLVGDLQAWDRWTPWREEDPTIVTTFGEKTTGVGASQSWKGKSGSGELVFTACSETHGVVYEMSFDDGTYRSTGALAYGDAPVGGTKVTWSMKGDVGFNPVGRLFAALMDKMVGPMFDRGLARLKAEAEAEASRVAEPDATEDQRPAAAGAAGG